jgi:hypothetical protein
MVAGAAAGVCGMTARNRVLPKWHHDADDAWIDAHLRQCRELQHDPSVGDNRRAYEVARAHERVKRGVPPVCTDSLGLELSIALLSVLLSVPLMCCDAIGAAWRASFRWLP